MGIDVVSYALAKNSAKAYTDSVVSGIGSGFTYKGSVATVSALPESADLGDEYTISDGSGSYAWDGTAWSRVAEKGAKGDTGNQGAPGRVGDVKVNGASVLSGSDALITVVDNTTSTSTSSPLSAHMGKELQDEINNIKNIGRFLAIWNCSTGLPLTNPTTMPYDYHTGDYYRVGVVSSTEGASNYKPNGSQYSGTASSTVDENTVGVGYVYYYDGSQWLAQSAGGSGTVQDVQVNGTSVVASGTGVANIPQSTASQLGVIKIGERVSGQSYPSGTFTYVAEV